MFTKEFLVKESQTAKMLGSGDLEGPIISWGNNCRNGVRIAPLISIRGRGDNRCYDDQH